jgi:hypothetical protein
MRGSNRCPSWWALYTITALFIIVLLLEVKMPLSETAHYTIEVVIVLLFYSLVWMWLSANEQVLMRDEMQRERKQKLRLLKARAPKPAPLAGDPAAEPQGAPGGLKTVLAWIVSIALAIYRFF